MSPGGTYERDLYKSAALHATDCQHLRVTFATLPNWLFLARSKAGAGGGIQKMTWRNLLTWSGRRRRRRRRPRTWRIMKLCQLRHKLRTLNGPARGTR